MQLEKIDWDALARLRENFISDEKVETRYWRGDRDLLSYHETFGARIGWKWDTVLNEVATRAARFSNNGALPKTLCDWGCGTGVATLRILRYFPHIQKVSLWDHSPEAVQFAQSQIQATFPSVEVEILSRPPSSAELLIISHVLNELSDSEVLGMANLISRSQEVLWVENGTKATSRKLSIVRDEILHDKAWRALAPCTHSAACGVLTETNHNHWCHSFAHSPAEIHHDEGWREFSRRMGIDLRRLPYSFLHLKKVTAGAVPDVKTNEWYRVLGLAREYKGFAKILACHESNGVAEIILQKRDVPELFKAFHKEKFEIPLLKLKVEQGKIRSGEFL